MSDRRQAIPIVGLAATIAATMYLVVQLNGQGTAAGADFTNAASAQVRDAQVRIVLQGQFTAMEQDDEDVERRATLAPTGVDADAAGEAEVEFAMTAPKKQEIEFSVENLEPGATFTFMIDNTDVATATADRRGRADVEIDVNLPGAVASR